MMGARLNRWGFALSFLAFASQPSFGANVISGGACASQGPWTGRAMEQANSIISTAQRLQNDPNCKALVTALQSVADNPATQALQNNANAAFNAGPGSKFETLPHDLMALRTVLMENTGNEALTKRLSPLLAQSAVDLATNSAALNGPISGDDLKNLEDRLSNTEAVGEALLSAVFTSLPANQQCIQKEKNADSGLALLSASIRMLGALSSSDRARTSRLSTLVGQFTNFLRTMQYTKVIEGVDLAQFWTEMSCFVETTQQTFCNARDGLQLLDFEANEAQIMADLRAKLENKEIEKDSAIEGYVLLGREAATVEDWLQKVQAGVQSKNAADANNKNEIWTAVVALTQSINNIQGAFNENLILYRDLTSVEQKQQNIRVLLQTVMTYINANRGRYNFFTQIMQPAFIPFYLIGRTSIPDEVLGGTDSNGQRIVPMDPNTYMQDLRKVPELKEPDALMAKILENLTSLCDSALLAGNKYFAANMTVDHINLVDEAFTSSTITVYDSLNNIRNYIARLGAKFAQSGGAQENLSLSIADTLSRIDIVIARFVEISRAAEKYNVKMKDGSIDLNRMSNLSGEELDQIQKLYKELITSAYDSFNLLMQKNVFITQRLSTYVRYDLFQRMQTQEDMSPYVQYLLMASGKNVMNRLQDFQAYNAAEAEADLSEAQRLNSVNLAEVETLFAGDVWNYINQLNKELGLPFVKRPTANPFRPLYALITDLPAVFWDEISHLPGRYGKEENQDVDGTLRFLRAKLCTQTLAFKEWYKFTDLCEGAVLESRLTSKVDDSLRLKMKYNDLVKDNDANFGERLRMFFGGPPPEGQRYQHVCTLRDFYRNNQVYWLTLDYNAGAVAKPPIVPELPFGEPVSPTPVPTPEEDGTKKEPAPAPDPFDDGSDGGTKGGGSSGGTGVPSGLLF